MLLLRPLIAFLLLSIPFATTAAELNSKTNPNFTTPTNNFLFIDNGTIRLGIKPDSGAAIAWFSQSFQTHSDNGTNSNPNPINPQNATNPAPQNLINHWDRGRLIQQSYYGNSDGSLWNKQPWRWNPVQGGDWRGSPARALEIRSTTNSIYTRTLPKHWATGADLTNTTMESWITLTGAIAHVHFKFTYTGDTTHEPRDQEIPAVFIEPEYKTLVLYDGDKPWTDAPLHRSVPGWPNESRKTTEHWAAYINEKNFGLGVCVPISDHLTCYRFGDGQREHGSCSYFAPLTTFAIKPNFTFEYDAYLTCGPIEEIRHRFAKLPRRKE